MQTLEILRTDSLPAREGALLVNVFYTGSETTRLAMQEAVRLTEGFEGHIRIISLTVVPFPAPLDTPLVSKQFVQDRITALVSGHTVENSVLMCYCRDEVNALGCLLEANSLVVIGGRHRWWRTKERRIAEHLRRAGHQVVFVEKPKE